jgi:endonuclease-3
VPRSLPSRPRTKGYKSAAADLGTASRSTKSESLEARTKRAGRILAGLKKLYPDADCELKHLSALQLLVATILSAQSTDETVNKVTPVLFARFSTADKIAAADPTEVEKLVHTTGFFRQKTRSVIGACKKIVEQFGGQVPDTMDALTQLPGVARKTANVILGTWFHKNEGFVVDTHVGRLAHRLGLTWTSKDEKDAVKIEQDLCQVFPRPEWTFAGHALIWHGRRVCFARKPNCAGCALNQICPSAFSFEPDNSTKPEGRKRT